MNLIPSTPLRQGHVIAATAVGQARRPHIITDSLIVVVCFEDMPFAVLVGDDISWWWPPVKPLDGLP